MRSSVNEEEERIPAGGFLHLLPLHLAQGMVCSAIQASMLPWNSPSHLAIIGEVGESDGASPVLVIGYEWPSTWLRTLEPLSSFDLEWFHVQRYRTDYVAGRGMHPFWNVQRGDNPPDVVVETPDGRLGLECTRFAIESRQKAHGLFRLVRQRIGKVNPEHFAALGGQMVYMWFNDDEKSLGRPFGRSENEAAEILVDALATYRPNPEQLWVEGGGLPDPAPELPLIRTDQGVAFYCVPMVNSVPDSTLFAYGGFEIGLAYTTTHPLRTEWAGLWNRIRMEKDRPGNEWLLISAGAPDKRGVIHPSEEALADALLSVPFELEGLKNLKRVTLHFWSTGKAVDIWPERREVFGPLYQGLAVAHRPLTPPSGPTTS